MSSPPLVVSPPSATRTRAATWELTPSAQLVANSSAAAADERRLVGLNLYTYTPLEACIGYNPTSLYGATVTCTTATMPQSCLITCPHGMAAYFAASTFTCSATRQRGVCSYNCNGCTATCNADVAIGMTEATFNSRACGDCTVVVSTTTTEICGNTGIAAPVSASSIVAAGSYSFATDDTPSCYSIVPPVFTASIAMQQLRCVACTPPLIPNATYTVVEPGDSGAAGPYRVEFTCTLGYYAASRVVTCDPYTTTYLPALSTSMCTACVPPAAPTTTLVPVTAPLTPGVARFACVAGWWGPPQQTTCVRNSSIQAWSPPLNAVAPCTPCGLPVYDGNYTVRVDVTSVVGGHPAAVTVGCNRAVAVGVDTALTCHNATGAWLGPPPSCRVR